jgi:deazaflavin-dependent oxidoreductase (nitroreductase family)
VPTDEEFLTNNNRVIAEFRASGGRRPDLRFPFLLLTTTGARSGLRRTSPLGYVVDGGTVFVVGSRAGTPRHPSWYRNLVADPEVAVELGEHTYAAKAVVAEGADRERLFAAALAHNPLYTEYERAAERVFPVVVLEGVPAPA